MKSSLTQEQIDVIKGIFDVGTRKSAKALGTLLGCEVKVAGLPLASTVKPAETDIEMLVAPEKFLMGTSTRFTGAIAGEAMFLLPSDEVVKLSAAVLGECGAVGEEVGTQDVIEEVGNILVNACFARSADLLKLRFRSTAPIYMTGMDEISGRFHALPAEEVFWFRFRLTTDEPDMTCYILYLLNPAQGLSSAVQKIMERIHD